MASLEKECFWGCELNKEKKEYNWDSEDEELSKTDIEQKLVLSQACLGAKAKQNERNIVEVTTTDISENSVTHTILSLQSGKKEQCRLSLGFPSSVVFRLVEGSGPVHLTGSIYQELFIDEDDDEDDSDEDEKPSNVEKSDAKLASKKRPLVSETPKGPPKKLARVADEEESEDESDEDEEDEEESSEEAEKMEVETKQKQKKPDTTLKESSKTEDKDAKKKKGEEESEEGEESAEEESDDEDDDEDDDDEDESDEESDEEGGEDDDDEDESEEEDEIAASLTAKKKGGKADLKKPMTNGVTKPSKKTAAEEKGKPNKVQAKQQPATPKTGGKKEDGKKAAPKTPQQQMDMEQIKEKLKKTPTLPKKVDKFKNYMRSSFKITDDEVVTKLWDWLKENK